MLKFLNRPALALASVLAVIFIVILFKSYVKLVDDLSDSLYEAEERDVVDLVQNESTSEVYGPQIPPPPLKAPKVVSNQPITLGTFEALRGTCFLQNGQVFSFQEPDDFQDLQDLIPTTEQRHESNNDDTIKSDTLGQLLDMSFSGSEENSYFNFVSEISRYRMYSPKSTAVDDLLYDMKTQPIYTVREFANGSQFKARTVFDNEIVALMKPMRTARDQQALPNQIYYAEYERHTSEIAAYHLDRVLGFYRAMPVIGRKVNMIVEIMRVCEPQLQRTFFISPKPDENVCFIGNCDDYCDSYHPICGNGSMIETSLSAFYPEAEGAELKSIAHPWQQSYSEKEPAEWETNPDFCENIKTQSEYSKGRMLLELIDLSILDFLTGNMDRYNYQRFKAFSHDTFVLSSDNGRAFGKAFHDELKILAPMLQCGMIRSSTLKTLLGFHNGNKPLSERMRDSMESDPIAPILWEPHLTALDRRVVIVLQAVRDCLARKPAEDVIISSDTVDFT